MKLPAPSNSIRNQPGVDPKNSALRHVSRHVFALVSRLGTGDSHHIRVPIEEFADKIHTHTPYLRP
jgi:hypothetical protein